MAMVAPKVVGTLASSAGMDVCDDIEAPVLADLVILLEALPLRKCMQKDAKFL